MNWILVAIILSHADPSTVGVSTRSNLSKAQCEKVAKELSKDNPLIKTFCFENGRKAKK